MEKTIVIDGKHVRFKSTGATPLRYKAQFHKDFFVDILKLNSLKKLNTGEDLTAKDIELVDFDVLYNITWVMAKTANSSIPEPLEWLDSFNKFPLMDIVPQVQDLIGSSLQAKKKVESSGEQQEISTETFLVLCNRCGLTNVDLENMTIGMCLDFIEEFVEMNKPEKDKIRKASQSDFDAF